MAGKPRRKDRDARATAASAAALLASWRETADACFERGDLDEARKFYLKLLRSASDRGWCQYQLGRIDSKEEHWVEAVKRFDAALKEDNADVWNHFEKANALAKLNDDPKAVAEEVIAFIRGSPNKLNEKHDAMLLRHAHAAFSARLHDEAGVLYDWLAKKGQGGFICGLRRAWLRLQNNDPKNALQILRTLDSHEDDDFRVHLLEARAFLALGRNADSAAALRFIIARAPENIEALRLLFTALERMPDKSELRDPEELLRGLSGGRSFEFRLRAKFACEDYDAAAKLYAEYPASVTRRHVELVARAMHAAVRKRNFAATDALFEMAGGLESNSARLVAAQVLSHLTRKKLEAAAQLLQDAEHLFLTTGNAELRQLKLEYLCQSMQLDEASKFIATWTAEGGLPETVTAIVAGLLSARGEWDGVLDFLRSRISQKFGIANDVLLEAVARAARATGRYQDVLEQLDAQLQRAPDAHLSTFRDRLLCEQMLIAEVEGRETDVLSLDAISSPYFARRAEALSRSLTRRPRDDVEGNIYFCSDLNYFVGTSVALFSLLQNNFSIRKRCTISVVCEDEILDFASDICGRIGAAFSVPIRMVAARSLLGVARDFKSNWGLFTTSQGLSDAAYYRIFAAQQLLAEGARGRALYIDSDTCVGGGVEQILSFDLEGHPLGARPEVAELLEIARAAVKLGIEPEKYFNSGVLLFDLDHPDLAAALAQAVEISVNQKELLTFVDQCALNLAFRDRNAALPEKFNWFLRQSTPIETIPPDPIILHFLARPKPWDPMYGAVHYMRWVREFLQLAELLPSGLRKRLLASQFARSNLPAPMPVQTATFTENDQTDSSPAMVSSSA